jgi:hypothetical protein
VAGLFQDVRKPLMGSLTKLNNKIEAQVDNASIRASFDSRHFSVARHESVIECARLSPVVFHGKWMAIFVVVEIPGFIL